MYVAVPLTKEEVAFAPVSRASIETLYATGYWLFSQDRFADAAAVFRVMLQVAPADERPWLALGECHERIEQWNLALELYGAGSVAAAPAVRCLVARSRILRRFDRDDDAASALDEAMELAEASDDAALVALVRKEAARR